VSHLNGRALEKWKPKPKSRSKWHKDSAEVVSLANVQFAWA